ncbi:MAG: hypothetical protein M1829_000204 [Trizodia sp. TS-e1964]|nr:MAG: hypothetical protein M1829_000204 [Trizodia sp. TS-e1964]
MSIAQHVRGSMDNKGVPKSGFLRLRDRLESNPGSNGAAYNTSLTLDNSGAVIADANCLFGDLAGLAMPQIMSPGFLDFSQRRQRLLNAPCFGRTLSSQSYFSSAQIITSSARNQAMTDVQVDDLDCPLSYSLSLDVSVLRPGSRLGHLWFPSLDLVVPLKPLQVIIFQRVEQHAVTPLYTVPSDKSPLPYGYQEETKFNVLRHPIGGTMNRTSPLNWNGTLWWHLKSTAHVVITALSYFSRAGCLSHLLSIRRQRPKGLFGRFFL